MYTKQEIIIKYYREGRSQRSISVELGISRKTVRKYIEEHNRLLENKGLKGGILSKSLSKPPEYNSATRSKRKLTTEVASEIDKLLKENQEKRTNGLRKQVLKKCDIHEHLLALGYDIGYTTVCNYISSVERSSKGNREAFIRQSYQPAGQCEFDWGEVKLVIGGKKTKLYMAVFTGAYSNYRYAGLYHRQDSLSFLESHVAFFSHIQGVYHQMLYDNMRVAIARFVGNKEKKPTDALLQLRGHYGFSHRFCNFYRGNEKGHVERSVEYIRRKAFGIKDKFESLTRAEQWLTTRLEDINGKPQRLKGKSASELLKEEKQTLFPAPVAMSCIEEMELRADKYATVSFKTNRYSVPDTMAGRLITVKISSSEVIVPLEGGGRYHHPRSFGKHEWVIYINHYLSTFRKKPGALAGSTALAGRTYLKELYLTKFTNQSRDFIELLVYCHKHRITDTVLRQTVMRLERLVTSPISCEHIKAMLGNEEQGTAYNPVFSGSGKEDTITLLAQEQLRAQAALL